MRIRPAYRQIGPSHRFLPDALLERVGFEPVVPPLFFMVDQAERPYPPSSRSTATDSSGPTPGTVHCRVAAGAIRLEPRVPSWFSAIAAAGSRIPTASRSSTSVHSPTTRFTTLGGQYRRHQYRLERLSALVLNDHAYDKLTGWSNVIPVVPVKGDATATYKFIKEESHGTRSTPHRHRS